MGAAAGSNRLSNLSDDVLIHVVSFLPSKEAARTTILSHRWRCPLWLDTAVVNLDSRSYTTTAGDASQASDANNAVAFQHSHGRVPSKISVVMHDGSMHDDVLRAACRYEAAVEELRLNCKDGGWPPSVWEFCKGCPDSDMYSLPPDTLPLAALRVLDLNGCRLMDMKQPRRRVAFPCLAELRLRLCAMDRATLQDIVSAAPVLADLCLESLSFTDPWTCTYDHCLRLGCPAAAAITMTNMIARETDRCTVEIDAPRLRCFGYTQHVWFGAFEEVITFKSPPPDLERVEIELRSAAAPLRSVLGVNRCAARVLKLAVFSIVDIVVDHALNKYIYGGIVPEFPNLERLQIEELCGSLDDHAAAGSAIQNLLRRCPAIRELRLKFTYIDQTFIDPTDYAAAMSELTPCKSSLDDDGGGCCVVPYFPLASTDGWPYSLRTVEVRSDVEELTCFQVQLVRFLAKNAESLKEVDIFGGGKRYELSCLKVDKWRAGPSTPRYLGCRQLWPPSQLPSYCFPPLPDLKALHLDEEYASTTTNVNSCS